MSELRLPDGITVHVWSKDRPPQRLDNWRTAGRAMRDGIIWIDMEDLAERSTAADAFDAMQLPGFDRAMLGHLFEGVGPEGFRAEQVQWYSERIASTLNRPRHASFLNAFALEADVSPGPWDPPWVYLKSVDFLVGYGSWLFTIRRRGHASDGHHMNSAAPFEHAAMQRFARDNWQRFRAAPDLAILLLRGVVGTYAPALAAIDRRLQDLQQGYMRGRNDPNEAGSLDDAGYRSGLLQVKWAVDGLSRQILPLSRPAMDVRTAWFRLVAPAATDTAEQVQELLERAERTLARHREELRESFALIAASQASEQMALAHELQLRAIDADEREQRFERLVQFVAAALLGPALVAAAFGALPAVYGDSPVSRAVVVVGSIVLAAALSLAGLAVYRRWSAAAASASKP